MRRRSLRRLGVGGDADAGLAARQRHELLAPDDRFDLREPLAVVRQDRVADQLLLLQLADDVAIVSRRHALRLGDHRRQALHLPLDLVEGLARHLRERLRPQRHADLLERERVELRRQAEVRARLRQDFGAYEVLISSELLLQGLEWFAPSFDLVLLEQLLQSVDEDRAV